MKSTNRHLSYGDSGFGGVALCGTRGHDIDLVENPKDVSCRNCQKAIKRRNRQGDW